jgi:hypothetical protein
MLIGQRDRARHTIRIETGLGHERACARTCRVQLPSVGAILVSAEPSSTKLNHPLANDIEAAWDGWLDEMLELDVARSVRCRIEAAARSCRALLGQLNHRFIAAHGFWITGRLICGRGRHHAQRGVAQSRMCAGRSSSPVVRESETALLQQTRIRIAAIPA